MGRSYPLGGRCLLGPNLKNHPARNREPVTGLQHTSQRPGAVWSRRCTSNTAICRTASVTSVWAFSRSWTSFSWTPTMCWWTWSTLLMEEGRRGTVSKTHACSWWVGTLNQEKKSSTHCWPHCWPHQNEGFLIKVPIQNPTVWKLEFWLILQKIFDFKNLIIDHYTSSFVGFITQGGLQICKTENGNLGKCTLWRPWSGVSMHRKDKI